MAATAAVSPAELEHLVLLMYGGVAPQPGGPTQQQALAWLLTFADAPAAWHACLGLLASPHPSVQYYAANGVYVRVCRSTASLSDADRVEVHRTLWAALELRGPLLSPLAAKRLCLAIATAAVLDRRSGGVAALVQRCVASAASPTAPTQLYFDILSAVVDEADDKPLSRDRAADVKAQLRGCTQPVLALCEQQLRVLLGSLSNRQHEGEGGQDLPPTLTLSVSASLATAERWLSFGVPLGVLATTHPHLLDGALTVLLAVPHAGMAGAAASLLESAVAAAAGPHREPERDAAVGLLVTRLVGGAPYLQAAMEAARWDLVRPIALVVSAVGCAEERWYVGLHAADPPPSSFTAAQLAALFPHVVAAADSPAAAAAAPTIGGAPVGLGVLFGGLLLQLCAARDRRVSQICLDAFMSVQSLPLGERHPFFCKPVFRALLRVLLRQCVREGAAGGDADAVDDYRASHSPLLDALYDCFSALKGEFVGVLLGCVPPPRPGGVRGPEHWAAVEAVLFALTTQHSEMSDLLEDEGGGDGDAEESIVSLLLLCTGHLGEDGAALGQQQAMPPIPPLMATACAWIGGLHRWLAGLNASTTLRFATGPPFSPPPPPSHLPVVDASFGTVPASLLLGSVLTFLAQAVVSGAAGGGRGGGDGDAAALAVRAAAHVAGIELSRAASSQQGGGGAGGGGGGGGGVDDEEEEGGSAIEAAGRGGVAGAAASALLRICRGSGAAVASSASITSLSGVLASASVAGLGVAPAADVVQALLHLVAALPPTELGAAAAASSPTRDQALHYVMEPVLAGLESAAAAAVTTSSSLPALTTAGVTVARHCALLITALRSPAMESPRWDVAAAAAANSSLSSESVPPTPAA